MLALISETAVSRATPNSLEDRGSATFTTCKQAQNLTRSNSGAWMQMLGRLKYTGEMCGLFATDDGGVSQQKWWKPVV